MENFIKFFRIEMSFTEEMERVFETDNIDLVVHQNDYVPCRI